MKITIKGAYGETNFGDDLLMLVFENYFKAKFPNAALNFVGRDADYVHQLLSDSSKYNVQSFDADWLVYGGGTQFFSFSKQSLSLMKKVGIVLKRPSVLLNKFKPKAPIKYNKVAFLGFGIGPFKENEQAINTAKTKVCEADFIGVRDEVSNMYCKDWGVDAVLGADVVFSSYFDIKKYIQERSCVNNTGKGKIGIIIRDWGLDKEGDAYIEKIMAFYKSNKEYDFQFIIFAPHKDPKFLARLKEEDILIWNPDKYTITDFITKLNDFDAFISARYHGAIVAALLGKSVICIEIEDKLKILTQQIPELKLWTKPFETLELEVMLKSIERIPNYEKSLSHLNKMADTMLEEFNSSI